MRLFLPFPCKLPCREAGNLGFSPSPFSLSLSLSSLINCNYLFEILKTAAKTMMTTTTTTPKSTMAAMGGALEDGETVVGRATQRRSSVGPWENPLQLYPACNSHNAPCARQLSLPNLRYHSLSNIKFRPSEVTMSKPIHCGAPG